MRALLLLWLALPASASNVAKETAPARPVVGLPQLAQTPQLDAAAGLDAARIDGPGALPSAPLQALEAGLEQARSDGNGAAAQAELDAAFEDSVRPEEAADPIPGDTGSPEPLPPSGPGPEKPGKPAVPVPGKRLFSFLGAPVHSTFGASTWLGWGVTYQMFWDAASPLTARFWLGSLVFGAALVLGQLFHDAAQTAALRFYGVAVKRVELTALGGRVVYDAPPGRPWLDFAAVAAGPLANLGVALLSFAAAGLTGGVAAFLLTSLAQVNLSLTLYNLIVSPALDGGRLLRNALQVWLGDAVRAWTVAARIGVGFGVFSMIAPFAFWGVFDPVRSVMIALAGALGAFTSWRMRQPPRG